MKEYFVTSVDEDNSLLGKTAFLANYKIIDPDTTIINSKTMERLIVFGKMQEHRSYLGLVSMLKGIKFQTNTRLSRLAISEEKNKEERTSDLTFGYSQPNPIFSLPAKPCVANTQYPDLYNKLIELGQDLITKYSYFAPDKYAFHSDLIKNNINPNWVIPGTVFTEGIINNSNALKYHYDRGNFDNLWSCMAVFSHGVKGGLLVIPSLGVALNTLQNCYVLFNGQAHIHGVTEIYRGQGIAYVRNFILNYCRKAFHAWYWMLDDDIEQFYETSSDQKLLKIDGKTALLKAQELLTPIQDSIGQAALEYSQFAWSSKKAISVNPGYCDVAVAINVDMTRLCHYRGYVNLKEDRDFTLQALKNGAGTARLKQLSFKVPKNGSNKGGLFEDYKTKTVEAEAVKRMVELWGSDICRPITKTDGRQDVSINWKFFK